MSGAGGVGGVGGAGDISWYSPAMGDKLAALPRDIRNIILGSLSEDEREMKASIDKVNELYREKIQDQEIWKKIAKEWNIKIDSTRNIKDQVLREISRVTDLAIECVIDPADKAIILANRDPLERFALIEKWMGAHPNEAVRFFNRCAFTKDTEEIAATPIFARLILGNVNFEAVKFSTLSTAFPTAISIGSLEAVKILLENGVIPPSSALLESISGKKPKIEIFQLLLEFGITESEHFITRPIIILEEGSENRTDQIFIAVIDKEDIRLLDMLLAHGLVPSPKVLAYAGDKLGAGSDLLKILRDSRDRTIDYSDKASIESFIKKRWGNLPRDKFMDLFLKDFSSGDFQFFGGVDKDFINGHPAIKECILDLLKRAKPNQDQMDFFIKVCVSYGFEDLFQSFLESGLLQPDYKIPRWVLEDIREDGNIEAENILIRSGRLEPE